MGAEWLPSIYQRRVRAERTRAYRVDIPRRENAATIQYTLLGIELKVGRKRLACPDLATARYLSVFIRLGCREFAIPYDITAISPVADELETSLQRTFLLADESGISRTAAAKAVRDEILAIGPGDPMPLFDRETRQRKGD